MRDKLGSRFQLAGRRRPTPECCPLLCAPVSSPPCLLPLPAMPRPSCNLRSSSLKPYCRLTVRASVLGRVSAVRGSVGGLSWCSRRERLGRGDHRLSAAGGEERRRGEARREAGGARRRLRAASCELLSGAVCSWAGASSSRGRVHGRGAREADRPHRARAGRPPLGNSAQPESRRGTELEAVAAPALGSQRGSQAKQRLCTELLGGRS